jgi:MYXO-CTERM domain-containing protein
MGAMHRGSFRALSFVLALVLIPEVAMADWPMYRHDPQRTGSSPGHANLASPVVSWGRYIGGALYDGQLTSLDVDGDGIAETVFVTAGKLVAKRADDRLVWETPLLGLYSIDGVDDLNGDGEQDIIVSGEGIVGIVGSRDGRLEWRTRRDSFGTWFGAVRLADFDHDGRNDLYASDGACGNTGSMGDVAWAFHFADGFGSGTEDSATRLWQLERGRDYACGYPDTVADLTGDGHPDVVAFGNDQMYLFDGTNGRKIAPSSDAGAYGSYPLGFSLPYGDVTTTVADTDGDGRPEIIGLNNSRTSRAVFVIAFDPTRPEAERLYVRWRASVPDVSTDTHAFTGDAVSDLDGDGRPEIVTTFDVAGSGPTTYVYRAADGAVVATIPGVTVAGVFDPGGGTHAHVLATDSSHTLRGYTFASFAGAGGDAGPVPTPAPAWSIPSALPLRAYDVRTEHTTTGRTMTLGLPDRDGIHRALVVTQTNAVQLWSVFGASATMLASHDMGRVTTVTAQPEQDVLLHGPGLMLAQSDGFLLVLDANLAVINLGTVELPLPGVRIGGYYAGGCSSQFAPVSAAPAAGSAESLFVVDSQSRTLRLDAEHANRITPPDVQFAWADAISPTLLDADGNGTVDLLALTSPRDAVDDYRALEARRVDGTTVLWTATIPTLPNEYLFPDIVPLRGATRADTRFTVQTFDTGTDSVRSYAVNVSGTQVWATDPAHTGGGSWLGGRGTALDVNDDGREDLFRGTNAYPWIIDGATGTLLGTVDQYVWAMAAVATRGHAGAVDFVMTGTAGPLAGYSVQPGTTDPTARTLRREWVGTATPFTTCYGATLSCADGLRVGNARVDSAHLLALDAATGTQRFDVVLAGGRVFATDADAAAAGVRVGTIGDVTGIASLTGASGAPAFLVGSTDGYLYAIDACAETPALLWSLNFRTPVGAPVFADYDADGEQEIVVEAGDGFVYGLDTERFPAPMWVYDTDPRNGIVDTDVDEVHGTMLATAWSPVAGATGYEWALFTAGGTAITRRTGEPANPFIPVGATITTATVDATEGLVSGTRYVFAVRAVGPLGASAETASDGVLYIETHAGSEPSPDGGIEDAGGSDGGAMDASGDVASIDAGDGARADAGGGGHASCGCRAAGRRGERGAWLVLLGLVVTFARRRRREKSAELNPATR